jgi:hypothetical protein
MNRLAVSSFQLEVDEVLQSEDDIPALFSGHTPNGEHYLVRHAAGHDRTVIWMFARISERALACVRTGRAELRSAFTHTATGAVDIVNVELDGHCTETFKLCDEILDEDLPPVGTHLPLCASRIDRVPRRQPSGEAAEDPEHLEKVLIGGEGGTNSSGAQRTTHSA